MKTLLLYIGILFSFISVSAQTMPVVNADFEATMTPNSNYVNTYNIPGWIGFNSAPETAAPYEGTQAVKIEVTVDPFLNSWLSNGSDTVPGYIVQTVDGPFTEDVFFTRVSFAYKFTQMETDTAYIQFGIVDDNQNFLYLNYLLLSNTVDWTYVSMDLLFAVDGNLNQFVFYATPALKNYGTVTNHTITPGTTLWIDDVQVSNYAGIEEENPSNVSIYPNPVSSKFTVAADHEMEAIRILSIDGKLLEEIVPNAISTEISMESFPAGTYFISVTTNGMVTTKELIKE